MSDIGDVHVDQALSNFATQLPVDQGMIADFICPVVPVKNESDKYYIFRREELRLEDVDRADGAEAPELEFSFTTATYTCQEYAKRTVVTDRVINNSDSQIRPLQRGTEKLVTTLRLAKENRVKTLVETTGNWGGNTSPSTKWNASGADIESDVNAAKQAFFLQCGRAPNTAVINDLVLDAIIAWIRSTPGGINMREWLSMDQNAQQMAGPDPRLRGFLGIENWLVGRAIYDSADTSTTTESMARLYASNCALLYVNPRPSLMNHSAMYAFQKRPAAVKKWREESRDGTWVQVSQIRTEKVTQSAAGYILTSVLT